MWVQNYESSIQVYKLCSKGSGRTVVSLLIHQDYPISSKRKRVNVGAELWVHQPGLQNVAKVQACSIIRTTLPVVKERSVMWVQVNESNLQAYKLYVARVQEEE